MGGLVYCIIVNVIYNSAKFYDSYFSLFFSQYLGGLSNYNSALNYLCKDQKYRMRAMDIARNDGLLTKTKKNRKGKVRYYC